MKPGHIKVFDGLRITTEHMDHLQGAAHSALQEIREILGLGRVYFGFEARAEDDRSVTVLPGLAFDYQRNRLACDEPKTLPVSFEPGEEAKFVCVKYAQVEDGQVEGRFTMIWDDCSVILQPSLPGPEESLIPIAQVMKPADGDDKLKVVSLISTSWGEKGMNEAESPPDENAASEAKPWRLQVRQGVTRLSAENGDGNYINRALLEMLKNKLNGGGALNDAEAMITLAEKEVALDFPVSSVSLQTIINAGLGAAGNGYEEKCQVTATGESTFAGDAVSQYGVSTIRSYADAGSNWSPWPVSDLTESGVANLPLSALWKTAEGRGPEATQSPLQHIQLLIKTDKATGPGFKVVCNLLWGGEISEEIIRSLESQNNNFTWESLVAWKAMGESQE
jgi:hypothetical protein